MQAATLAKWPDGSARWVLVDFLASSEGGARSEYALSTGKAKTDVKNPAVAKRDGKTVTLSNGIVTFRGRGRLEPPRLGGRQAAEILSLVELGEGQAHHFEDHHRLPRRLRRRAGARGRVFAAGGIYSRRDGGARGPSAWRCSPGSPYVRVEDTFIYAHFPGSHAKPQNPLALWKSRRARRAQTNASRREYRSCTREEAEGLVCRGRRRVLGRQALRPLAPHGRGAYRRGHAGNRARPRQVRGGACRPHAAPAARARPASRVWRLYAHTTPRGLRGKRRPRQFRAGDAGQVRGGRRRHQAGARLLDVVPGQRPRRVFSARGRGTGSSTGATGSAVHRQPKQAHRLAIPRGPLRLGL